MPPRWTPPASSLLSRALLLKRGVHPRRLASEEFVEPIPRVSHPRLSTCPTPPRRYRAPARALPESADQPRHRGGAARPAAPHESALCRALQYSRDDSAGHAPATRPACAGPSPTHHGPGPLPGPLHAEPPRPALRPGQDVEPTCADPSL